MMVNLNLDTSAIKKGPGGRLCDGNLLSFSFYLKPFFPFLPYITKSKIAEFNF